MSDELCPWVKFHGTKPYDFVICEENLCAWIRQPANTWSNLAIVWIGLYLIRRGRTDSSESDALLGMTAVLVGICSAVCHASGIPLLSFLDVTSIFLFMNFLIAMLLVKAKILPPQFGFGFTGIAFLISLLMQLVLGKLQIILLIAYVSLAFFIEIFTSGRGLGFRRHNLWAAVISLSAGIGALALDYTKTACVPDRHFFQFHALWHVLSGVAIYFIATYLRQFDIRFRNSES